jgi:DNA-binding MarR family transcriptional regulator
VANQQDRRSFLLSVTPAGQSLLKQLAAPLETQLRTVVFKNMSTTQLEQLCQLLETVKNNLQEASF